MKKKIIITLTLVCLFYVVGGLYIIRTIERSTTTLNNLITLHQVEILREQLLIQIKRVQSDLNLHDTRYARGIDTTVNHVRNMEQVISECFNCHHTEDVAKSLNEFKDETYTYKIALSRVYTVRANAERLIIEKDRAFQTGEELISKLNDMISMARTRLDRKTGSVIREISNTQSLLYFLMLLGPVLTVIFGTYFLRQFSRPMSQLLDATRRLKVGDLDHRITGLSDEFGEVAGSFNEMAWSLKDHMYKMLESEKRYRMLFESAGDAIFILEAEGDDAGRIVSANHAAAEMHGYTIEELLELNIMDLDTPDIAEKAPDRIRRMLEGETIHIEMTHRKKDGTVFPVEVIAGLLEFQTHKYIFAYDRDITERKEAETALQDQLHFQQLMIDSIPIPVFYKDIQGRYLGCNKAFESFLGLGKKEIIGKTVYDLAPKELADTYYAKDNELINNPGRQIYEFSVKDVDGDIHHVIFNKATFHKPDGSVDGLIGAISDITERKRAEEAMQRTEQMVACGQLATRLVHEIKNPLAGIKIAMEVLAEDSSITKEDTGVLEKVIQEVQRIDLLMKSLLNFSRPTKPQLMKVDVRNLLDRTFPFIEKQSSHLMKRSAAIKIVRDFEDHLPEIMADPMQLQQVFLNILLNALDAMPRGGTLRIRTSHQTSESAVYVEISDTGKGIDKESMDKLFQPFFTSKPKGTGLGLTITQLIVEQHDGHIRVSNNQDGGATFTISFPTTTLNQTVQS